MSLTASVAGRYWWRLIAVAALPGQLCAQAIPDLAFATEQHYVTLIEQEQDERGHTSRDLIEPLTALGQQYFAREDYERALEAFSTARQITRVNDGFDTVGELQLLEQLVRTEEARGNPVGAWQLEETLLALTRRQSGRVETVPVLRDIANKRLDVRRRYLVGEKLPQIELGCYYAKDAAINALIRGDLLFRALDDGRGNCGAGDRDTVNVALLMEARTYQIQALDALLQNGRYTSVETWDVLMEVLRTSDLLQRRLPLFDDKELEPLLERLLSHPATDRASTVRRAEILVHVADRNVVRKRQADRYSGYDAVLDQYREAYAALQGADIPQAEIDALFAPATPVVLPAVYPNPLAPVAATDAVGYIDVEFDLTHQGKARRIDVIAMSEGLERRDRRELAQLIDQGTFRPRFVNGQIAETERVRLRYYVAAEAD